MPVAAAGTPWAAVLGDPIVHSLSPALHGAAYRELGLPWRYERIRTPLEQAESVIAPALRDPLWRGFSVTMPLKARAAQFADRLTPLARQVGVVNTLAPGTDASRARFIFGENTDVAGIVRALGGGGCPDGTETPDPAATPEVGAAIIGGGGTASAAAVALHQMGARTARVYLRDPSRAEGLRAAAERIGLQLDFRPLERAAAELEEIELAVCTLPARAFDEHLGPLAEQTDATTPEHQDEGPLSRLRLLDVSYDPWPSRLATAATARGAAVSSGLQMLYHQAVEQVRLFTRAVPAPGQEASGAASSETGADWPEEPRVRAAMKRVVGLEESTRS